MLRNWNRQEFSIPGADKKNRGLSALGKRMVVMTHFSDSIHEVFETISSQVKSSHFVQESMRLDELKLRFRITSRFAYPF